MSCGARIDRQVERLTEIEVAGLLGYLYIFEALSSHAFIYGVAWNHAESARRLRPTLRGCTEPADSCVTNSITCHAIPEHRVRVGAIATGRRHIIGALPHDGCQTLIGRGVCVRQSGFGGLGLPFADTHILFAERPASAAAQRGNCQ